MTLEMGKAEYLCELFPNIWPITDPNMEAKQQDIISHKVTME